VADPVRDPALSYASFGQPGPPGPGVSSRVTARAVTARPSPGGTGVRPAGLNAARFGNGERVLHRENPNPVKLAVLAGDHVSGQGATAYLATCDKVRVLLADQHSEAEVFLLIVDRIDQGTLDVMQRAADSGPAAARFVVVGDGLRERHLFQAIAYGLVSVLPRSEADFEQIVKAICDIRDDKLEMPGVAVGWVVRRLRTIHSEILEPRNLTAAGLEVREAQVLRMLSQGLDTAEIAKELNYSERTVKNIVSSVLRRLKMRNRVQAVAFAINEGLI
jgi:DNA-binding NarL/FixJ family response regulator